MIETLCKLGVIIGIVGTIFTTFSVLHDKSTFNEKISWFTIFSILLAFFGMAICGFTYTPSPKENYNNIINSLEHIYTKTKDTLNKIKEEKENNNDT